MHPKITIEACAKINLGLEIGNPGSDGYHPLVGLFHSVNLSDRVEISIKPGRRKVEVEGSFDCPVEHTTVFRAATLYLEATSGEYEVHISVLKRIPVQAGMGGGSADAAAVLHALDMLLGGKFETAKLAAMGAVIGSDVPFFLYGGAALVSGKGEKIEPVRPRTDFGILLAYPGFGVSTREAYAALDRKRAVSDESPKIIDENVSNAVKQALIRQFNLAPTTWEFHNSFEDVLFELHPEYFTLVNLLKTLGAHHVGITGSGSCMYGVFDSYEKSRTALAEALAPETTPLWGKALPGLVLHALKPLETSLLVR